MRSEASGAQRHHVIAFAPSTDAWSDCDDSSRTLVPEKEILVVENWIDGERFHHVAEIDRRSCDLDLDLASSWATSMQAP
jgi:hypothetical protein